MEAADEVDIHGRFSGKVKSGGEESAAYEALVQKINNHYQNEQMVATTPHPVKTNELYIGKSSKDKKWHRVRVESVLSRSQGYHATCFFVDEGSYEMIPLAFLRNIPDAYLGVPFQLKNFYMYGITPITLTISSEDLMTSMQPTMVWDSAAVHFIKTNIELSSSYEAYVKEQKSDGSLGIRLYLKIMTKKFCLNEELVNKGYAADSSREATEDNFVQQQQETLVKPKRTITEVLKKKKIVLKPPTMSDGEDYNYASEPDSRPAIGGSDSEKGYATDSLSIPHRHRVTQVPQKFHSETIMQNKHIDQEAESQEKECINDTLSTPKAIFAKLEASLKASRRTTSEFDPHSQENYQVRPKQDSLKGSQSSLARLQMSSTTVTSYNQSVSDSNSSDFSAGAQSDVPKFQTVSQISPQTGLLSNSRQIMKGYQSDTSHSHIKSDLAHRNMFSPHLFSDNENDRCVQQYNKYDNSLFTSSNQSPPVVSLKQLDSPQGIKRERESKTDSPLALLAKQLSGSSSSVSGFISPVKEWGTGHSYMNTGSPGRGRGMIPSYSDIEPPGRGRGISPSYSDTGSPGRGQGIVPSYSDNESHSPSYLNTGSHVKGQGYSLSYVDSLPKLGSSQAKQRADNQNIHGKNDNMDVQNSQVPSTDFTMKKEPHSCTRNLFKEVGSKDIFSSDNESPFQKPKPTVYSSGNETESSNVLARSVTGQAGFTKSRLPREVTGTQTDKQSLQKTLSKQTLPKSATLAYQKSPPVSDTEIRRQPERVMRSFDTDLELTSPLKRLTFSKDVDAAERTDEQKQKLLAKFTGQRMLKNLKENSGKQRTSPQEKQDKSKSKGMFGVEDNVLVHGSQPKKPIYKFSDARFAEVVSQYWLHKDFPAPQVVQAYSWPAIRQGKHVIAISPEKTGKTLAYLCPLITSLTHQTIYKDVGPGNGPYLVILTPSWRKAKNIFLETMQLLGDRHDLRIILLHAGGQEENKAAQLINGCEIMVVTPPCLKRIITARYTNLRRLCHLVIDDAEEILENFGEEMIFTMRQYTEVITNQRSHAEAPRQFLVFGSQWTGRIHSFMKIYPVEPLLIITSAFEASIYGKVKHITHMCVTDERIREVTGVLENTTEDNRTIIFAAKKEDIIKLYKIIKNYSHYCRMVYQDMEMHEVSEVAEEWRLHKLPLLVCCDEHITEMRISDANTIINYDLPCSKTRFCNRLACMRKYFWDFSTDEEQKVQPVSHLIISEDCKGSQVYSILQLLKRSSSHVPPQLKAMMAGASRGKEEDEEKELCSQLLAFGFCRNQWKCICRHIVFPEIDHTPEVDWVPDEGEVKVSITHVIDATHYFVRLLSVNHGDSKEDLGIVYSQLQLDIGLWYGNLGNLVRHKSPYEGEICGYQDRENFYRVQILRFRDMNCRGAANIDVTVKFIDSGRVDDIPAHKLYELPAHLKEVPFQAVEVFVCRVKPVDRDTEWTNMANLFICNLLKNKIVEGKIVLRLGGILWLDPLVERHSLGETRTVINKAYIHRELITNGFADENPNHLEKLYKLCENKVKIPKALIKKAKLENKLETDVLPECKQYHTVVVSSVARPDLFFVQRKEKLDELEDLMDTISSLMTSQDPVEDVGVEVKVGDYCLAEYSSYDKRWYRGRVTKLEEDTCEVFFADYGDRDTVPRDKVRKIPNDDRLTDLPLQGIECSLADIVPRGSGWSEKVGDVMWDLTHLVNGNDMKTFTAKVKSKEMPYYAGRFRFVIDMYDTSGAEDFNLAQELVYRNLGAPMENSAVLELFDKPSKLRMMVMSAPLQDIPDLCASIYWEQDETRALKLAGDINNKLRAALTSRLIQMDKSVIMAAVGSVVKLVGRVAWTDVNRLILDTILVIARSNERLSEELLKESCEDQIIRCLELQGQICVLVVVAILEECCMASADMQWLFNQNSDPEIQCHAVDIVGRLVQVSDRMRNCFEDQKNIEVLYDLFDSTESQQIQGMVCRAFCILCANSSVFTYLMSKKEDKTSLCPSLTKLLNQSADHDVIEAVILLLLALSHQNSGHPDLERESLLQSIILTLNKSNCEKCIYHCVKYCSNFGAQRRKHKTVLLELEMVPCLSRILQTDLSEATTEMCKDLLNSLAIKVPTQEMSGVLVRSQEEQVSKSYSEVPPEIHWTQNSFNVMLSVKVKGVSNSPDLVKVEDDMVTFRAVVDGMCYAFTYKLFDSVMTDHNRIRVKSSEVLISMKKVEKGKWPRLLYQKQKPANLSIDFERFVDSSDSEFCDEDEPFMFKRKKKAKVFSNKDAPKKNPDTLEPADDSETDTTDSLEMMEDRDRDPYNIFD